MYDGPVYGLLEALEQSSEDIFEGVKAVICNPPCNSIWNERLKILEHDFLSLQYMSQVA